MNDKITKTFHEFKKANLQKQVADDVFNQNLSNDIEILNKLDNGEYTIATGTFTIDKILGVITDQDEIKKLEEAAGGFQLSTDLTLKEVKRGDVIWLTALLKRPHSSTPFNQTTMGVIKARIMDYYYGLNKLKSINNYTDIKNESVSTKEQNLMIYKNKQSTPFNYTVIRDNELYLVKIIRDQDMVMTYKGKIDRKVYSVNGTVVSNPSKKMIYIIQNKIADIREERNKK